MQIEPRTENGKILSAVFKKWLRLQDKTLLEKLKRVLYLYSSKITHQVSFISALYGQNVLDEPPPDSLLSSPAIVLRVQQVIEVSLDKSCLWELVVALEWSENDDILNEILKWAEDVETNGITEGVHAMDLAPEKAHSSFRSLFARSSLKFPKPRERKIQWNGHLEVLSVFEVCGNKIILGWDSGQVRIYNAVDLRCTATFQYCGHIKCFQCTCSEIMASYDDGNICVWNIKSGALMQKFLVGNNSDGNHYPICMRWIQPKLFVADDLGRISMWQYLNSSFKSLGYWSVGVSQDWKRVVEFNLNYIVFLHNSSVKVYHPSGQIARTIIYGDSKPRDIALHGDHLFIGYGNKIVSVYDVNTGHCSKDLGGHADEVTSVAANGNCIVSVDQRGQILLWDLAVAVKEESRAVGAAARIPIVTSAISVTSASLYNGKSYKLRLGPYFFIKYDTNDPHSGITVTDFPC